MALNPSFDRNAFRTLTHFAPPAAETDDEEGEASAMDLNETQQEHKRFIVTVVAGLLTFFIANSVVDSLYDGDINKKQGTIRRAGRSWPRTSTPRTDRVLAEDENELTASYAEMPEAVACARGQASSPTARRP